MRPISFLTVAILLFSIPLEASQIKIGVPLIGAEAPKKADSVLKLPHYSTVLENGLRVFMVKFATPGAAAYQLPVRVGSRNEVETGKTGFAHFFEHLMFRGTRTLSADEFGQLYVRLGCENNAWTWYDLTNYNGMVATAYLPDVLSAEADRFANLYFSEKSLRDEAGAVKGEYNKAIANPSLVVEEALAELAFTKHPYGHTTLGYKTDIDDYPNRYEDVWPFFRRYYRPDNMSVVLVGDIDFDRELTTIRKLFGSWNPDPVTQPEIPREPEQNESRQTTVTLDRPIQSRIAIAYKTPSFTTESREWSALRLINEIYFSDVSAFQNTYRFEKRWIDDVSSPVFESVDPYLWTIELTLTDEGDTRTETLIEAVNDVMAGIVQDGPELRVLRENIARLGKQDRIGWFSSPSGLASAVAWYVSLEPDFEVLTRIETQLSETTDEDLRRFAARYLTPTRQSIVILKGATR